MFARTELELRHRTRELHDLRVPARHGRGAARQTNTVTCVTAPAPAGMVSTCFEHSLVRPVDSKMKHAVHMHLRVNVE